jgi:hypothetical protein
MYGNLDPCVCAEWQNKYKDTEMAVSFTCPKHGSVTFDFRSIPAPRPMLSASPQLPPGSLRTGY